MNKSYLKWSLAGGLLATGLFITCLIIWGITKESIAFSGVILFGGGQVNPTDLMTQGLEEKTKLEEELMNGYGEAEPPVFFIQ